MDSKTPVIVSACRTPIGKYLGGLASFSAPQLGAIAIREAVKRAGVDVNAIDEVIMGHVLQGGSGQAPGRQAAIHAGIPGTVPALTINKVCGSGLKAVMLAAQAIKAVTPSASSRVARSRCLPRRTISTATATASRRATRRSSTA
jgi:acetyl-CoA C-acetyltransferase